MVERTAVNRDVVGSSPTRGAFLNFILRLHGQAVKTPPFHGGNRGSNPLGVISGQNGYLACIFTRIAGSFLDQRVCAYVEDAVVMPTWLNWQSS